MNALLFLLALLALVVTQMLAGGRYLALCLPGYGLLAVAAILSWWPSRRLSIPRRSGECLAAAVLFFGYIVGRAYFSPEEYLARKDLYMALGAMALYLLTALSLSAAKWRGFFVGGLLLLGMANCLIGAVQFTRGQEFMPLWFLSRPIYGARASGFYGYPNHLAMFLEIGMFLGLSIAIWSRWRPWVRILAGYGSLLCGAGILLSASRGGVLGALVGLMAFGIMSLRLTTAFSRNRAICLLVAGCLLFGALGLGVQHFVKKSMVLQSRVEQTIGGGDVRFQIWKSAWQQFRLRPAVGTGSGTFLYYGREFRQPSVQSDPIHSHNEYLELLAEYGVIGIALGLMFLDTHLRGGWRSFTRQISVQSDGLSVGGNTLALTVGALSVVVSCMAHSLVDFTLHMPANMLAMAFVFGLLANPDGASQPNPTSEESEIPAIFRLALPAVGIWIAVQALPTLPAEYYGERARLIVSDWKYMESDELAHKVLDYARRGQSIDPRNPELHLYAAMGQTALALQASDPAVKQQWTEASLASNREAMKLAPGDLRFVLSVLWALDEQKRFEESEPVMQLALKLDPKSGSVRYTYGAHLRAQGKLAEALAEFQRALRLEHSRTYEIAYEEVTEELKAASRGQGQAPGQRQDAR